MNRLNEIGDTPKGQYSLGQVYARANKRRRGIIDDWNKQMPKKEYYTAAEYYPKGTKKYDDIMHDAKAEAECPPNRKVNMKPVVYNDKGYETTNFGLGVMDYEKSHKTNENKQYTNMKKRIIRLTEGDLHRIVKKSVNRILRESYEDYLASLSPEEFRERTEQDMYNVYGNQSQYPAYEYIPPAEGELGMTAQYSDEDRDRRMSDYDPEYFLDGRYDDYRSKMPGNYCTNESRIMRRRRMR